MRRREGVGKDESYSGCARRSEYAASPALVDAPHSPATGHADCELILANGTNLVFHDGSSVKLTGKTYTCMNGQWVQTFNTYTVGGSASPLSTSSGSLLATP